MTGKRTGKPNGRPRTTTPGTDHLIELGEDLLKWVKEEPPKGEFRNRFCDWYSIKYKMTTKQWELLIAKPEFQAYYEEAKCYLGNKWLYGNINPSYGHRFLRIYCPEVKREEDEKIAYEIKLKAQLAQIEHPNSKKLDELIDAVKGSNAPQPKADPVV